MCGTLQQFVNPGIGCQTAKVRQLRDMPRRWADHAASQITEPCCNACSALPVVRRHQPTTLHALPTRSLLAASFDDVSWSFDASTRAMLWCCTTAGVQSSEQTSPACQPNHRKRVSSAGTKNIK
jgi:hypothetical protein